MKKIIEFDEKCQACNGAGVYIGVAERDGVAVVCYKCGGTGCFHFKHEYEDFVKKDIKNNVVRVVEINPGICIGASDVFGGMSYAEWLSGKKFVPGMENRNYTCPAWWYQCADYNKKPNWDMCIGIGSFSQCRYFSHKDECWKRWDKEFNV